MHVRAVRVNHILESYSRIITSSIRHGSPSRTCAQVAACTPAGDTRDVTDVVMQEGSILVDNLTDPHSTVVAIIGEKGRTGTLSESSQRILRRMSP